MGNTISWYFAFTIFFLTITGVYAQKATFRLKSTFTSAEIPKNTKVYLIPSDKNAVVAYGMDISDLDVRVIKNVLLITSSKEIPKGHILIYYHVKRLLDDPVKSKTALPKVIKV